jgi:hypothetical protein
MYQRDEDNSVNVEEVVAAEEKSGSCEGVNITCKHVTCF